MVACACGCGTDPGVYTRTNRQRNYVAGQPREYALGHAQAKPWKTDRYRREDRGYGSPCWLWQMKRKHGNGVPLTCVGLKEMRADRLYFEEAFGPLEPDQTVEHLCGEKGCVNPDHLAPTLRRGAVAWLEEDRGFETPCWIWQLCKQENGYGQKTIPGPRPGGTTVLAHRWVWEQERGPIPDGRHLHHRCEIPACVNPDHLEPLTPGEHLRRHGNG